MAADSTSSTRRASAIAGWIVASRMTAVFRGFDIAVMVTQGNPPQRHKGHKEIPL
jgi:hypothetical protein